jgi:simple sugar transport system permease protein
MRISPSLIPFLAVLTAFLFGIPLIMIIEGSVPRGLQTSGVAYSALIEGITGLAINDVMTPDNLEAISSYADTVTISRDGLTRQARPIERVDSIGADNLRYFEQVLSRYPDLTDDEIAAIGPAIQAMRDIGEARVRPAGELIARLEADGLSRARIKQLTTLVSRRTTLSASERAQAAALWPPIAAMSDAELRPTLDYLNLMDTYTAQSIADYAAYLKRFDELGIALASDDASALTRIAENNPARVREAFDTLKALEAAGVASAAQLGEELRLVGSLYSQGLLTSDDVNTALEREIPALLANTLIIRRPGDNVLAGVGQADAITGTLTDLQGLPVSYLRLGGSALVFVPSQLETTIVRSIPYIIIGVAVGLGFAAGVFNIGAEGQLHVGAMAAAWIGIALVGAPSIVHVPLVLLLGLIGGLLWGGIPGILKAFTGASEVVVTIMMNFIAALYIDWLIKQDPPILRDPASSVPRTLPIEESARLPLFGSLPPWIFFVLALAVFALLAWQSRDRTPRRWLRPVLMAGLTLALGFFIQAINVTNKIHIGFILMFVVVFGVDWYLQRTTSGFELRTVGINQSAAKYAGMNVALNVALAMGLSGMLAGLAGAIEISGREYAMVPNIFAGFGFESISVALLARKNPRNMIWSGLLWGGLLSAAGLMQIRADVSIDLVKIIQALIIMFVAADQIIRFIYRIPESTDESKLIFSAR